MRVGIRTGQLNILDTLTAAQLRQVEVFLDLPPEKDIPRVDDAPDLNEKLKLLGF